MKLKHIRVVRRFGIISFPFFIMFCLLSIIFVKVEYLGLHSLKSMWIVFFK